MINKEFERTQKGLRYCIGICLKGLKKTTGTTGIASSRPRFEETTS
jgi:hypothetical protein